MFSFFKSVILVFLVTVNVTSFSEKGGDFVLSAQFFLFVFDAIFLGA